MVEIPNSSLLNICILPSVDTARTCVELSQSLGTEKTQFVLDGRSRFPHMTSYMARFPESEIQNVIYAVEKIVTETNGFVCEHAGFFITSGGYLEISYIKTAELLALQSAVIGAIRKYRSNPGKEIEESYYSSNAEEKRKNVRDTGYDLVGTLYRPHISLTRYQEGKIPEAIPTFPVANLTFKSKRIGIYRADDNGAVYEELGLCALT